MIPYRWTFWFVVVLVAPYDKINEIKMCGVRDLPIPMFALALRESGDL